MKNPITAGLAIVTLGLILNNVAVAGEDVDAFTLSFQNNTQEIIERDAVISKASFTTHHALSDNFLDLHYDSAD